MRPKKKRTSFKSEPNLFGIQINFYIMCALKSPYFTKKHFSCYHDPWPLLWPLFIISTDGLLLKYSLVCLSSNLSKPTARLSVAGVLSCPQVSVLSPKALLNRFLASSVVPSMSTYRSSRVASASPPGHPSLWLSLLLHLLCIYLTSALFLTCCTYLTVTLVNSIPTPYAWTYTRTCQPACLSTSNCL